jgi:hypothetical protein
MLDAFIIDEIRRREEVEDRPTVDIPYWDPDWTPPEPMDTGSSDRGVTIIDMNP